MPGVRLSVWPNGYTRSPPPMKERIRVRFLKRISLIQAAILLRSAVIEQWVTAVEMTNVNHMEVWKERWPHVRRRITIIYVILACLVL